MTAIAWSHLMQTRYGNSRRIYSEIIVLQHQFPLRLEGHILHLNSNNQPEKLQSIIPLNIFRTNEFLIAPFAGFSQWQ